MHKELTKRKTMRSQKTSLMVCVLTREWSVLS